MKTAVIFCDKISERRLSHTIKDFLKIRTRFSFLNYSTGFDTDNLKVEILKNYGGEDIEGKYYKWYIDISSSTSDSKQFEEKIHELNTKLESKCRTWTDWNYYLNL